MTVAGAFVCIVAKAAAGVTPVWTLIALLTLPLAWRVWNGLRAHYTDPYTLMPTMQTNITLHWLTGHLLVIGYVIAVVS